VADVARRLAGPARIPEFVRVPPAFDGHDLDGYLARLGIGYRAPADARATDLADGSIDVVTSTNTLEHVPPEDILSILRECRRILADDGLMTFRIGYKDHFSYFDHSISAYNFLTLDEGSWRRRNSSLAFQNRLRHRDYVELVRAAGFDIVEVEVNAGTEEHRRQVATLPLAPPYDHMPVEDLVVRDSRMVLAKAG
jgi:SAM-dependent methyltransferase